MSPDLPTNATTPPKSTSSTAQTPLTAARDAQGHSRVPLPAAPEATLPAASPAPGSLAAPRKRRRAATASARNVTSAARRQVRLEVTVGPIVTAWPWATGAVPAGPAGPMIDCAPAPAPLARRSHRTLSSIRTAPTRTAPIAQRPVLHRRRRFLLLLRRRPSVDSCCRETVSGQSPLKRSAGHSRRERSDRRAGERQRAVEPVGYADQQRLEAQRETGAQRRVRRRAVARFPYALFPSCRPFRCSTAGALAKAWNTRGNGPYTLDPYTPTFSAQRVYGSRRLPWSTHLVAVRPSCRPRQRRTGASSARLRGTSRYPYGSSHEASATPGAARSSHHRTVLPQALQTWREAVLPPRDLVASDCGRPCGHSTATHLGALIAMPCLAGAVVLASAPSHRRASTCHTASEAGDPHFLIGVRPGPVTPLLLSLHPPTSARASHRRPPPGRFSWTHQKKRPPMATTGLAGPA